MLGSLLADDADYIAAFTPQTITALCKELEQARKVVVAADAANTASLCVNTSEETAGDYMDYLANALQQYRETVK